jgi:hypothetical protein
MNTTQTKPFSGLHAVGYEAWKDLTKSYLDSLAKIQVELKTLQGKEVDKATAAIDEGATLIKRSLELTSEAYADWRQQAHDASRAYTEAAFTLAK